MALNTQRHTILHIVFVHGFRGDHTSFQRFPTHVHIALQDSIPSLQSHIYPTYKSRQALQYSVQRLIEWIDKLDPGYIILIGHSLGGFVVAEAALQYKTKPGSSQIIGLLACDVPYLGIHPHVIVSGIVSLFPNKGAESEHDMNDTDKINVAHPSDNGSPKSIDGSSSALPASPRSVSSRLSELSIAPFIDLTPGPTMWENTLHFFKKHADDPLLAMKNWTVSHWEHGSMLLDLEELRSRYKRLENWQGGDWINFYTETVPSKATTEEGITERPTIKHSESTPTLQQTQKDQGGLRPPNSLTAQLNLSSPNLGFPVPDVPSDPTQITPSDNQNIALPSESIYPLLNNQADPSVQNQSNDPEVSFPVPKHYSASNIAEEEIIADSSSSRLSVDTSISIRTGDEDPQTAASELPPPPPLHPSRSREQSKREKTNKNEPRKLFKRSKDEVTQQSKAQETEGKANEKDNATTESEGCKSPSTPRRFIVIPSSRSRQHWERVAVAGAVHEVDAHCGIFFPNKNLEYDTFVQRVADLILQWCRKRPGIVVE